MSTVQLIQGDCLTHMKDVPPDAVVVSDPPFNVGYHYASYKDSLPKKEYMDLLRVALRPPCVIIHYPEAICDIAIAFGQAQSESRSGFIHRIRLVSGEE